MQRMPINCELDYGAGGRAVCEPMFPEAARRYWSYQRLEPSDQLQTRELKAAQAFLLDQFGHQFGHQFGLPEPGSDRELQRRLMQQVRSADPAVARLALACLRCFISHQMPPIALGLEQQFGAQTGLKRADLYAYLLDDPDPMLDLAPYQPLALRILRRFDPNQSGLGGWTKRLVGQDKRLSQMLLKDYGIYLATDWGILLQAKPEQLQRLLAKQLSPAEIAQFCQILDCYHRIYRRDRLAQRLGGSRCADPTPEQIQQMLADLQASGHLPANPPPLLAKLRQLAQYLRLLKAKPLSIEIEPIGRQIERPVDQLSEAEQSQEQFLTAYRRLAQVCLQQTVNQLLAERIAYLRRRRSKAELPKDQAYLQAIRLFHCQSQSMSEIAPQVGLSQQYQVSRLLELPALQADLHQAWLLKICLELPALLQEIFDHAQMADLRQQLATFVDRLAEAKATEAAQPAANRAEPDDWRDQLRCFAADLPLVAPLESLIDRLLQDYRAEVYSPHRTRATGQIARCICQALNSQFP